MTAAKHDRDGIECYAHEVFVFGGSHALLSGSMSTIVYAARRIVTMNPSQPFATHVAVRDGRILGAGSLDSLKGWGTFDLDERFADKVILPGFVEGHSHA